jgi:hypothetical protein
VPRGGYDGRVDAARTFHALVGGLEYPMFIVTARAGGEPLGCLVGFATQTSIRPPRFLVCLSHNNRTYRRGRDLCPNSCDVTLIEQPLRTPVTGGGADAHARRKLGIRQPSLGLKGTKYINVDAVQDRHERLFRFSSDYGANSIKNHIYRCESKEKGRN